MAKLAKAAKTKAKAKEIKKDVKALKHNVVGLGKTVKGDATVQVQQVKKVLTKKLDRLQSDGKVQMRKLETQVRQKPVQALGIAFAAGLVASVLLRRR